MDERGAGNLLIPIFTQLSVCPKTGSRSLGQGKGLQHQNSRDPTGVVGVCWKECYLQHQQGCLCFNSVTLIPQKPGPCMLSETQFSHP